MIVCHCRVVRDDDVRSEVRLGADSLEAVMDSCGAGTDCGGCRPAVEDLVADERARASGAQATGA
jgi:bacterioferritin-associated ferredoxin